MKFRVALQLPDGDTHDVTLACDVTATVSDLARTLIRAGLAADPMLARIAAERLRPVTVRGRSAADAQPVLLDPGSPIAASGLQPGWTIEPVAEFGHAGAARLVEPAGYLEVLSGQQAGALYSLLPGPNLLGRDVTSRVYVGDKSVSRRHAVLDIAVSGAGAPEAAAGDVVLRDLGSANGTRVMGAAPDSPNQSLGDELLVSGQRLTDVGASSIVLRGPTEFQVGGVDLRFTPGPPARPRPALPHRTLHTRSPRVDPAFTESTRELPAPPGHAAPGRIPMLAMLAPMIMGGVLFAVTRSPMSLMMMAFSPVMMIGSWVDGRFGLRRKLRREGQGFRAALAAERRELAELRVEEIEVRGAETPTVAQIAEAIGERSGLLWARRPEHRSFLEVRFGEGTLPSRTQLTLPARGDSGKEPWDAVRQLESDFGSTPGLPILERLDRCGSIGVAGEPLFAAGLARSLVLQLVALHSPEELVLACFAGGANTVGMAGGASATAEWEWLKWLPHVDTVTSPIAAWQLADDDTSSARLLIALEGLIETRAAHGAGGQGNRHGAASPRSHLAAGTRNDAEHGEAVGARPHLPAVVVLVLGSAYSYPVHPGAPRSGSAHLGAAHSDGERAVHARLIALAEAGPDVGVHVIWVARSQAELPAACRTFAVLGQAAGTVGFVRTGAQVPLTRLEHVDTPVAVRLARALAPVEDAAARALDESDLPKEALLREVHPVDLTAGGAPILRAWQGTLADNWVRGADRDAVSLAAPVGQGPDGPVTIDLRLHGPHALVGGTTGAGKSEFLQSWIMSLAAQVSPDRLSFLLVDYKGGAAFAECVELPHTVGLVTDLSPHLVRRALTSLRAELRYREELLAEHGAKDLITMERRSDPAAPPALVIVVDEFAALASEVPEFVDGVVDVAQRGRSLGLHLILATQRPAGVIKDNLRANTNLRVALRMADEADSSDVIGVKDAAFFDPETPGRGAIKVGPGRIAHFQAGYLGGRPRARAAESTLELRSLGFSEGPPWAVPPEPGGRGDPAVESPREKPPRDIERLRDGIVEAARQAGTRAPRKPWLEVLPEQLALETLEPAPVIQQPAARQRATRERAGDAVAVGMRDLPEQQAQRPETIDLEQSGNVAIIGSSGAGKTGVLITLAAALSNQAAPRESPPVPAGSPPPLVSPGRVPSRSVEIYAIDAGGGALDAIRSLPTVAAVAPLADTELTGRVLQRVLAALTERAARYAAARCSGLAAYRATPAGVHEPRIVLLIDGFAALRQAAEALSGPVVQLQQLTEIMTTGRAAGVHVVITADRPGAIPAALAASVQAQYVLRLSSPHDYAYFGIPADALEDAPPGRAVRAGAAKRGPGGGAATPEELQFALAGGAPELHAQSRALEALGQRLREAGVADAPEVRNAPDRVTLAELPLELRGRPVFGICTGDVSGMGGTAGTGGMGAGLRTGPGLGDFAPVTLPTAGLCVIAGPSGAGLSTAAATCAAAAARRAQVSGASVQRILLTLTRDGLRQSAQWDRVAFGEDEVCDLARELTIALGGRTPRATGLGGALSGPLGSSLGSVSGSPRGLGSSLDPDPSAAPIASPDPAPAPQPGRRPGQPSTVVARTVAAHTVIVVERAAAAEGTAALAELTALAKAARRSEALVLFELEQGTGGTIWDLFAALKQPTWGLALQPDEQETQSPFRESLGRVKRANFPPGRGFSLEGGRVTPVQVAVAA